MTTQRPSTGTLPALDRRALMKAGILGAGLIGTPLAARIGGRGFTHGVASGEPGRDSVLLWSRYVGYQPARLSYEVATDLAFAQTVAGGEVEAAPDRDWCVKTTATGLEPGRWYYYRFLAPDGTASDIGRTRTLPEGPTEAFRMGVFSCSNLGFGWFNAYAHAAEADDIDLAIHVGDYFYEYPVGTYPAREQALAQRLDLTPDTETVSLADYRLRYATYRRDQDLRRLHQLFPMIAQWDDHESANDSYADGAENHQSDTEGDWQVRKTAAMRAYREWMPVSDEPWATYDIGDLATLIRVETRLTARSKPPSLESVLVGKADPADIAAALTTFRDTEYADAARTVLGQAQEAWLAGALAASKRSGKRWQVLSQQVLMGSLRTPQALADGLTDEAPAFARARIQAAALAGSQGIPFNMDAWDGYPAARARVFEAALEADADLVVLAGDTHNAWAFDLTHEGARVGVEFGGQSVTSPGFEAYIPLPADTLAGSMVAGNDQLRWANLKDRGYMRVELTPRSARAEYRFSDTVRQRSTRLSGTHRIATEVGERRLGV